MTRLPRKFSSASMFSKKWKLTQGRAAKETGWLADRRARFEPTPHSGNVYKEVCDVVTHTLDWNLKILEAQFDGSLLHSAAGSGWKEGLIFTAMVDAGPHSQAGYALQCNQPVVVEDLAGEARFVSRRLCFSITGSRSGLSVIIPGRERPPGVLGAHTSKRRKFKNEDVHISRALSRI